MLLLVISGSADSTKLGLLFEKYHGLLIHMAKGIVKDQAKAEDCVGDTFETVAKIIKMNPNAIGSVDSRKTCNFLITITKNKAINSIRNLYRESDIMEQADLYASEVDIEEQVINAVETRKILKSAVEHLDERYRLPLILRYYHDYTIREIALSLDISENYTSVLLHRAKSILKEALRDYA